MLKAASLFGQLLQKFPRVEFGKLVEKHGAERNAKGFTCWTQFVSMLFCQLARTDSLREICNGLSCCLGKLTHLGIKDAPRRSTLSYANEHRPAALYEDLFWTVLNRFRQEGSIGGLRKKRFQFHNKLLSLDSTTITLCLSLFPWADYRQTKGGVKLHVLLDHDDYMPAFVHITEAKPHDVTAAKLLNLQPGSIVAMDRAYNDFRLFADWTERGVYFVTRMKENTIYEVVQDRELPQRGNIRCDQTIRLSGPDAEAKCFRPLRRVVVWVPEQEREIILLTNHLDFGATTISAIYKDRWQIELFFKALKQNLKIKTFVGTSENALRIQIWTALIALLLLKWLHHLSQTQWSFANLASMLRLNLFTYRDLREWLDNPFTTPPITPDSGQLVLNLG